MNLNKIFPTDLAERAERDMQAVQTGPGSLFAMQDVVWVLVRNITTATQAGGILMYPDEVDQARDRLGRLLTVAVAAGWSGLNVLETVMARGAASEQLEALARTAGRHCDRHPEMLQEVLLDLFGDEADECIKVVPAGPL